MGVNRIIGGIIVLIAIVTGLFAPEYRIWIMLLAITCYLDKIISLLSKKKN